MDVRKTFQGHQDQQARMAFQLRASLLKLHQLSKSVSFPVWDITIPIYLLPILTASHFLDESAVQEAAGDQ